MKANGYWYHVSHSWKALLLIASVFQLVTVIYVVVTLFKGAFEFKMFLTIAGFGLLSGIIISLISAWVEIGQLDRIKTFFSDIKWHKLGGNLKLIDEYRNGWGRSVMVTGTYQNKKVKIQHQYEKGSKGRVVLLVVLVELEREFYEEAASVKFGSTSNELTITNLLNNAVTASKDPKFGEIYWELKRRRAGQRKKT